MLTVPAKPACSCEQPSGQHRQPEQLVVVGDPLRDRGRDQRVGGQREVAAVLLEAPDGQHRGVGRVRGNVGRARGRQHHGHHPASCHPGQRLAELADASGPPGTAAPPADRPQHVQRPGRRGHLNTLDGLQLPTRMPRRPGACRSCANGQPSRHSASSRARPAGQTCSARMHASAAAAGLAQHQQAQRTLHLHVGRRAVRRQQSFGLPVGSLSRSEPARSRRRAVVSLPQVRLGQRHLPQAHRLLLRCLPGGQARRTPRGDDTPADARRAR